LRLRLRYRHSGIPVSIEVEGEALTPESIPHVLGSILQPLESWLKRVERENRGFSLGKPSAPSQRIDTSHSLALHPSGCWAGSGPKRAEALKGDVQNEV